ncbi:MAG: alpha-galactosidase [Phycisphaerae bacterium]|nr:alpha-galactosidase [Phycisphaerae bacterium]
MIRSWLDALVGRCAPDPVVEIRVVQQGWGTVQSNRSILPGPLRLTGKEYQEGLGTHCPSELLVRTTQPMRRFQALVGVDDNFLTQPAGRRMVFSVLADGKVFWTSPERGVEDAPVEVDVDLKGRREFTLKVVEINGQHHAAHADWVRARAVLDDGRTMNLSLPCLPGLMHVEPFSFVYDGRPSSEILPGWAKTLSSKPGPDGTTLHTITYTDPKTNLVCILDLTEYADYPAVEWVLRFRNDGKSDTPILEDIQALRVIWAGEDDLTLHSSKGSDCRVDDFQYQTQSLPPNQEMLLATRGGRSSETCLPFFNVSGDGKGLITAIGWSGQWATRFSRGFGGVLTQTGGMEKTHLRLRSGEEIRSPRGLLLAWEGDPIDGHNLLRRFILKHGTRRIDGELPAPVCCASWGGMRSSEHLKRIPIIPKERLQYDYYWIDAGWYGREGNYSPSEFEGEWGSQVGNWNYNPTAHPKGLKPISDAIHAAGMKFLLWFEPERAVFGTPLTMEHPDWFLGKREPGNSLLLNLGNPEARKGITDIISNLIREHGVDAYRQDFNFGPLPFWRDADEPDRRGMTEIRHIEGLYAFWDALIEQFPDLLIDNCASGGRRIDLETIRRSIPLWRSDFQCWQGFDPTGSQVHSQGLLHWVPCSTTGVGLLPGDTYNFRGSMCTGVQLNLYPYEKNEIRDDYPYEWHRQRLAEMRRAKPFYFGDYYPLTAGDVSNEIWMAYQMHRPDLDEGMLLVFRRPESPYEQAVFSLKALSDQSTAVYILEDADTGKTEEIPAEELRKAFRITIPQSRQSRLLFYRRK